MTQLPIDLRVGNGENPLERASYKSQPERVTNQTLRSVTTNNIFCGDGLSFVVRGLDLGNHALGILREAFEFGVPPDILVMALQIFVKKLLSLALLQHQNKRKGAHASSHIREREFTSNLSVY